MRILRAPGSDEFDVVEHAGPVGVAGQEVLLEEHLQVPRRSRSPCPPVSCNDGSIFFTNPSGVREGGGTDLDQPPTFSFLTKRETPDQSQNLVTHTFEATVG